MKNEELKKNVTKKRTIINGFKYYELNIKRDNYIINITNLPKEELIKFKIYINKSNEINLSLKENYIIYENQFDLEYFKNQTSFLVELGIKNINDLIRFLYTFFQEYHEKIELKNQDKNNSNLLILKLQMFHNNIQINIELFNDLKNQKNIKANDDNNNQHNQLSLRPSNSCKNFFVHKKELKKRVYGSKNENENDNKLIENSNNNYFLNDYYISLIQKTIPLLQKITKEKLNLIYKSSQEKENPKFHIKCDDKGPTLIFIETEENRSFITFNKKSWHVKGGIQSENYSWRETNLRDDDIAIIDLFSKKIIKIKRKTEQIKNNPVINFIQQYSNYGPSYVDGNGFSFKIFGGDKYLSISFITKNNEEDDYIKNTYNLNKNNFLHIKDYEVYCFKKVDNK